MRLTFGRSTAAFISMVVLASSAVLTIAAPAAAQEPTCMGKVATITDNDGVDLDPTPFVIVGTAGDDVIVGTDFVDVIRGGNGRDIICGGLGKDRIGGGPKLDRIYGGGQGDVLDGGAGPDYLFGFGGDDEIRGGDGNDTINGGGGTDLCYQQRGSGPVRKCEKADLVLRITSPKTAPEGTIAFKVRVTNRGPNAVSYFLLLGEDNTKAACAGPQPWEGGRDYPVLKSGSSRTRAFSVTCESEAEGDEVAKVWVDAIVSNAGRETRPANNGPRRSTTIIE